MPIGSPDGSGFEAEAPVNPRSEYQKRHVDRAERLARGVRRDRWLADARLAIVVVGLILAWLAFGGRGLDARWLIAPVSAFVALVVVHERVARGTRRAARAEEFYSRNLKRIDGTWPGTGATGDRFANVDHLYAADLDLFGVGSLFERLCQARTRAGEETLARWLLEPADPSTIYERHEAVTELRNRLDLREDMMILGSDVREGIDPDVLTEWGQSPRVFRSRGPRLLATILALLGVGAAVLILFSAWGYVLLLGVVLVDVAFVIWYRSRVREVLAAVHRRTHDLRLLSGLLARLERERFRSPALVRIRERLETNHQPASRVIARLASLCNWLDARDNQFFAPFAALLIWTTHLAIFIDGWRAASGPAIARWLAAVGEFEALASLSAYAFENPADPFPEIVEDAPLFEGIALGHPLIREPICVRNDVALGSELSVLLVSGSNMSGKSTLLRTVGTNTVLALAGAPVHAESLRVSVFAIGATLRIQDSLQAGKSRFYAEITRVREIVDLARGTRPLLFLLDEIFHGTNSHDRTVGAEAIVRGLIDRGALGLVTTHDLALAAFADRLAPRAQNVHFEDQLRDGVMSFDYRMRPGVVRHSNALALMRAVGLDV